MASLEASIFIAATPQEVFDYVRDPGNLASHHGIVLHAETQGDGPIRSGSRFRGTSQILGRTYDWTAEIVDHERPSIISFQAVAGNISVTISYTMIPEGSGTRLAYRADARPSPGSSFSVVAETLAVEGYRRQVLVDLATLDRILAGSS
ncbi:hypothetical protein GCM10027449_05910 [Sinomonas notoginsengisoli]|uniref:SRPBCC family protein n=1 Tax=Sinomonas notoginsengisoli TaxID=1457311 RepID=UPI001F385E75|nr:SRPBCC family protein [Sinomonas notoginsengisoli]